MPDLKEERERDIAVNRRAYHDYFIDEKLEAGVMLTGTEGKAVRKGRANLRDGVVGIDGKQAVLEKVDLLPYAQANPLKHQPPRPRKPLLPTTQGADSPPRYAGRSACSRSEHAGWGRTAAHDDRTRY